MATATKSATSLLHEEEAPIQGISIKQKFPKGEAHSMKDGVTISKLIHEQLVLKREITVSFAGLSRVTMSFLNGCLGSIYANIDDSALKNLLHLSGTTPEIELMLKQLKWRVKNHKLHEKNLSKAISGS